MFDRSRFHKGEEVYDVNGRKVGSINDVMPNVLDVSAGFLGFDHLQIPIDEISRVDNDQVYLAIPQDAIRDTSWHREPAETTRARGMYGTMPAATEEQPGVIQQIPTELTGYDVYTSDDHKLGTIQDQEPSFVHLQTGFLGLGRDLYVPTDSIDGCDASSRRCYLNVRREQISDLHWNERPAPIENDFTGSGTQVERVPLVETDETPEAERRQRGHVEVTKHVEEQNVSYVVPVSHEEATIRQVPVDRPTDVQPNDQGDIRVPLYGETVDVKKGSRVYGEVEIEKRRVADQSHVEGTIHREVPEIHREGDVDEDVDVEGNLENRDENNPPRRMSR